jgi:hypothetical protein
MHPEEVITRALADLSLPHHWTRQTATMVVVFSGMFDVGGVL